MLHRFSKHQWFGVSDTDIVTAGFTGGFTDRLIQVERKFQNDLVFPILAGVMAQTDLHFLTKKRGGI